MPPQYLLDMPKIELHAHLNGSLSTESILELGAAVHGEHSKEFLQLAKEFADANGFEDIFKKFQFMHSLTATREGLALATELAIREFAQDNVMYVELRTTPKENEHMSRAEYLETVLGAIVRTVENYKNITVCLLPSIDRSQSVQSAIETLAEIVRARDVYNIPGIDLSGHPEKGCFNDFQPVLEDARAHGLKLALHCAEVDRPAEIEEMVAFGMDRCGHGTFLSDEQLLRLGRDNVGVECCLTSNVKSKTVNGYGDHHFGKIYRNSNTRHLPVLCTDDSGVFDTTLSKEFALAVTNHDLCPKDVLAISLNAVEQSFAEPDKKQELRTKLEKYFEQIL